MLRKLMSSTDPKVQQRLRELWVEWRQQAESEPVGELEPIEQPLPLRHYYEQELRPGQTVTEEVRNQMRCLTVSLVSEDTQRRFGLNMYKMSYHFGKFLKREEFAREVEAHRVLDAANCPHIIRADRAIQTNVEGEGIITTLRYKPYSTELLPHVKEVMHQLLQAISCCHSHQIIHRDIKPMNIVWEWKPDRTPHIYLIDFSIACKTDYYIGETTDCIDYTAIYRAPERMRWAVSEDPRQMDLWSAGVMFAEMLLGYDSYDKTLFEWGDLEELEEFEAKRKDLFKNIDPVARDLLDKLLTVEANDRVHAAEALQHPYFTQAIKKEELKEVRKRKRAVQRTKRNKKRRLS